MKIKSFRERFEDNYKAISVPANNKKGFKIRYVYYKPWHIWDLSHRDIKIKKRLIGSLFLFSLLFFIISSAQYTKINFDRVVGIATMLSVCALLFEALGVIQFCVSKNRTTEHNYFDTTRKIMFATILHASLLLIAAAGSITCMMTNGFSVSGTMVTCGYCVSAALAIVLRAQYRSIPLRTEANTYPTGSCG